MILILGGLILGGLAAMGILGIVVVAASMAIFGAPVILFLLYRFSRRGFKLLKIKSRPNPPSILLDKSLGEHKYMSVNGVKLHYVESGEVSKPLMLFVHGFPEFWFSWRHQITHFNKDYHVVAFDMRGYNTSSKPSGIANYKMSLLVEDIRALVTSLGKSEFHLVVHDWGGVVGWNFVAKYPDMVTTFIACNIPHSLSFREQVNSSWEQRLKSWYVLFFQCPVLPELNCMADDNQIFYKFLKDANLHKDEQIVEAFKYAFPNYTTWNRCINFYRALVRRISVEEFVPLLKDIKVPVLQIFGTADAYISVAAAEGSAKYVRDHELKLLDGVSHWVQQQEPDKVNKLIREFIVKKQCSTKMKKQGEQLYNRSFLVMKSHQTQSYIVDN